MGIGRDHLIDLPGDITSTTDFHLDFGWLHQSGRMRLLGDTPAVCNIQMFAFGFDRKACVCWKVQCVGHPGEYIRAFAHIGPFANVGGDFASPTQYHQGKFIFVSFKMP